MAIRDVILLHDNPQQRNCNLQHLRSVVEVARAVNGTALSRDNLQMKSDNHVRHFFVERETLPKQQQETNLQISTLDTKLLEAVSTFEFLISIRKDNERFRYKESSQHLISELEIKNQPSKSYRRRTHYSLSAFIQDLQKQQ
ncbi:hypothetical protein J6590_070718 [Homalodisca vitripennis]|nr:hypothetical protein J6590_070718 [Homalodisca vitripennis]